ncbi:EAL domain-containing protein [Glaciecola sp. MH2013]|nr:EAL domain-containing protein [Glaciecola sp. MH2013]
MQLPATGLEFKMERVVPFFQPIMNLASNRVWRYECLARLLGDNEHIFLPSEFLNIVEKENCNAELTHHIYEESRSYCKQRNMAWSINLADSDLDDESVVAWLIHQHQDSSSELFGIEISHHSLQAHLPVIGLLRQKCPTLGISVDGVIQLSESLVKAMSLDLNAVKLDGDLVKSLSGSVRDVNSEDDSGDKKEKQQFLLQELIAACNKTNTRLVAEHIESQETLDAVTRLGIKFGQGFYLSSPEGRV